MAGGDWLLVRDDVEMVRTPGYPFFLALIQLVFGRYALVATVVSQELMVFATALLAAWICSHVSGSRWGASCRS